MFLLSSAATCRIGFQSARWKNANRSDGSDSLFLSLSRLHSLARCFCSCLSLFSPIQLLHGLNPEPSSLLLSIHPRSVSAESLPGVALLRAAGGRGRGGCGRRKRREGKKRERGREKLRRQGRKRRWTRRKKGRCRTHRWTWDGGLCCLYYIGPFSVGSRRIECLVEQKHRGLFTICGLEAFL